MSGQVLPITALKGFDLAQAELESLCDIGNLQAARLAGLTQLLANWRFGDMGGAILDHRFLATDLLTHSKLPFRNS